MRKAVLGEIGRRLRIARISARLTQQDVATALAAQRQTVSAWERGEYPPTLLQLYEVAQMYGASSDFILYGVETIPVSGGPMIERIFGARREAEIEGPQRS